MYIQLYFGQIHSAHLLVSGQVSNFSTSTPLPPGKRLFNHRCCVQEVAGYQDIHNSMDEFEFHSDHITDYRVSCS